MAHQTIWLKRGSEITWSNQDVKISFKKGAKEITSHIAPNQAWFGTEYFLTYTPPDFKSKILTRLLDAQKDDAPLLFNLMGQCPKPFTGVEEH